LTTWGIGFHSYSNGKMLSNCLPVDLESFPEKKVLKPSCLPSKVSKLVMPRPQCLGFTVRS